MSEFDSPFPEPIELPLSDTLDLHTFRPKELPELLDDWLAACQEAGFEEVRIIHGKGKGVLRNRVQGLLGRHPLVAAFYLDHPGATVARLKKSREV